MAAATRQLTTQAPEDPAAALDFGDGAKQIKDFKADAVLVIGFGESSKLAAAYGERGATG